MSWPLFKKELVKNLRHGSVLSEGAMIAICLKILFEMGGGGGQMSDMSLLNSLFFA